MPPYQRWALGIGYMPQTAMVFDDLTVWENLTLGKTAQLPERYFDRFPRLGERRDQPAGTMSGGERKILAFVRCMIEDTSLLVLDEPSEGVQPENIERMAQCLTERANEGAGIVLCEQNIAFLSNVADRYMGLETGRMVMNADASEVSEQDVRAILTL